MQVKKRVKADGIVENHNETLVRVQPPSPGLKVKTKIKAGAPYYWPPMPLNHNETLVRVQKPKQGLRVKTHVKAGVTSSPVVVTLQ
jgi:hypothetical protein